MKRFIAGILVLLAIGAWAADKTVTVKPSGGTYATLAAAIAGELVANADLTALGVLTIECSGDLSDTSTVTINGFTTDATHYLVITTPQASRHAGVWDGAKYRLECNNACIIINDLHVRIDGLQIKMTTALTYKDCIRFSDLSGADIRISNCLIQGVGSDAADDFIGLSWAYSTGPSTAYIYNNIIYGFVNGTKTSCCGMQMNDGWTMYAYNNTVVDCYVGIKRANGTAHSYMNLVSDCTDCYSGTIDGDHNASTTSDAPGTNAHNVTRGTEFEFTNYAGDNFHLTASFDGTTDASGGLVTTDIDGAARTGTYDIGADEYVGAGGSVVPQLMYYRQQQ